MKLLLNVVGAAVLVSACAVESSERSPGPEGDPISLDSEQVNAASVEEPDLVVEVYNGTQLHFFVSEDGGTGVVEFGKEGVRSLLAQLPENATPYEVFHAVAAPGTAAPDGLQLDQAALDALSEESKELLARPQGWLVELNQSAITLKAAPIFCQSDHAFWATFCVQNPPGDTTYSQYDCSYNETGSFSRQVYAYRFSGGFCKNSGSTPHSVLRWRSKLPGSCGAPGNWTYVWNRSDWAWASYTWHGAYRDYYLSKGVSGPTDIGLKYAPVNCVL